MALAFRRDAVQNNGVAALLKAHQASEYVYKVRIEIAVFPAFRLKIYQLGALKIIFLNDCMVIAGNLINARNGKVPGRLQDPDDGFLFNQALD